MRWTGGRKKPRRGRRSLIAALRKQRQHRHSTTSSIARAPPVSKVAPVLSRAFDISLSIYNSVTMASSGVNVRAPMAQLLFLPVPDADGCSHRSSASQHSASVSHTVSTTNPPSLLPTSSARTRSCTSTSSPSSTRPVKSTRRRLLPRASLVVCCLLCLITLYQPIAYTNNQLFPTPATPSSTWNLGSSRSNRQFTLHILPYRPGDTSLPRAHEEDACFLDPTTKMRSSKYPRDST